MRISSVCCGLGVFGDVLAGGAFALSLQPSNHFFDISPSNDGYVAPRNVGWFG